MRVTNAKEVDPSTRFIGSHTSVLKRYIYSKTIPDGGIRIVQPCFQAQNLAVFGDESQDIDNGSVFECHGLLAKAQSIERVLRHVDAYLNDTLHLRGSIRYHVNSIDCDLLHLAQHVLDRRSILVDELEIASNRHQFGDPRLMGRDIRIDISDAGGKRLAMGVIIAMHLDGLFHCVEVALAPGRIVQSIYRRPHYLDVFPLTGLIGPNERITRKLEDCLVGIVLLAREGLRPGGSENKRKIMRAYLKFLGKTCTQVGISRESLMKVVTEYECRQYGNTTSAAILVEALGELDLHNFVPYCDEHP